MNDDQDKDKEFKELLKKFDKKIAEYFKRARKGIKAHKELQAEIRLKQK